MARLRPHLLVDLLVVQPKDQQFLLQNWGEAYPVA
jgi:hypothetical protein